MDMKTIRVSDEVFAALQKLAQPFVDSPNDVLERLLKIKREFIPVPATLQEVQTPQGKLRQMILDALNALGGAASKADVLAEVEKSNLLTIADFKTDANGRVAWRERAAWEVSTMKKDGLLVGRPHHKHGVWQLPQVKVA